MIFSVTHHLELHIPIFFTINVILYQVKMLMLFNVQTTKFIMCPLNMFIVNDWSNGNF